mmetsp:Transcript_16655/g.54249  ORF Transcript_16655/g.54249 Transcript_16655/m.54249 type:complete len:217 (-) Transcript_16655:742-1392(-)
MYMEVVARVLGRAERQRVRASASAGRRPRGNACGATVQQRALRLTHSRSPHTAHAAPRGAARPPPLGVGPTGARPHISGVTSYIYPLGALPSKGRARHERAALPARVGTKRANAGGSQFSATLPQRSHTVASRPPASRPSSAAAAAQWRRGLATPPPLPPGRPLEVRAAGTSHSPRCAPAKSSLARRCTRGRWPSAAEPELASRRAALQPHARPAH